MFTVQYIYFNNATLFNVTEMTDKWLEGGEPVMDGVAFCVKFLGSTLIEKVGAADAAEATKTVIQMVC